MIRYIHQSYSHVINICQILKPAAKNLIYYNRLNNNDNLDGIALDLRRYLNKNKINWNKSASCAHNYIDSRPPLHFFNNMKSSLRIFFIFPYILCLWLALAVCQAWRLLELLDLNKHIQHQSLSKRISK
jgi:hypothetical protein